MAGSISGDFPELAQRRLLTPSLAAGPEPSADLLRQLVDEPLRAADVAEPVDVLVVLHLANELPAVGSQASEDGVDVVDCECEMADARGVRRRVRVAARADGAWNLISSSRPWPSGVSIIAYSTRTPSRPTTRSTQPPST